MHLIDLWHLLCHIEHDHKVKDTIAHISRLFDSIEKPTGVLRELSDYQKRKASTACIHAEDREPLFMLHCIQDFLYNEGNSRKEMSLQEYETIISILNRYISNDRKLNHID